MICCSELEHDLYSCPRWLALLASGGRAPERDVSAGISRMPLHKESPTSNARYAADHLLRNLDVTLEEPPMIGGPASGYRTDFERDHRQHSSPVFEALRDIADETGRAIVVPFLPATARPAAGDGPVLVHEEVECWLRPAPHIDAYLATLPKSRRWTLRKELAAFNDAGLRLDLLPLEPPIQDEFAVLAAANAARHGGNDEPAQLAGHLAQISDHLGPDANLLAATDGDHLVGGVLVVRHRRKLFVRLVGFDYTRTSGTYCYFVLFFLGPTLLRHQLGDIDDVHLGVGALSTKLLHGARAEALSTWVYVPGNPLPAETGENADRRRVESSLAAAGGPGRRSLVERAIALAGERR